MRYPRTAVAAALFLIATCKQQEPVPLIPVSDPRLIAALTMRSGSYFVYVDSSTGGGDSFNVLYDFNRSYSYNEVQKVNHESVWYDAYHAAERLTGIGYGCGSGRQDAIGWNWHRLETGTTVAEGVLVKLPFNEGTTEELYGISTTAVRHHDTFTNAGRHYTDVYEMRSQHDAVQTHSYFSMDAGAVVRYEKTVSGVATVFNLVDSKTVR